MVAANGFDLLGELNRVVVCVVADIGSRSGIASPPTGPGVIVPITTFTPEPYRLKRDILAVVQPSEGGFIAGFFDANVHASGDTEEEAIRNLKSLMLDLFEALTIETRGNLGPEPTRQLAVLNEFIMREC